MRIQVGSLSEGVHRYRFESLPSDIGLGEEFRTPVTVDATLEKVGHQFYLEAAIRTKGRFQCDRCVSEFTADLSPKYRMYYVPEGSETGSFDPAEVQRIPPGSMVIDLAEDVRQMLLLAIPLKLLCSETCKGLCSRCGKNLNEGPCTCTDHEADPRWERLRSIQKN